MKTTTLAALLLALASPLLGPQALNAQTASPQAPNVPTPNARAHNAPVTVKDAWVRATVPQQKGTGAFMQLTATADTRLIGVTTPLTPIAEVHEMAMQDNVMRMRQVDSIDLPAGRTIALEPGGYHLMLMDLKQQVVEGQTVPLTLTFEDRTGTRRTLAIEAPVRALTATGGSSPASGNHDSHGNHGSHGARH